MHVGTAEVITVRAAARARHKSRGSRVLRAGAAAVLAVSSIVFATSPTAKAAAPARVSQHSTWSIEPMTERGDLSADSCVTAEFCVAVGAKINDDGAVVGGVEVWNGSTWKAQRTPQPGGSEYTELTGVWCVSVIACAAVGDFDSDDFEDDAPLAEVWNGSTWTISQAPNPAGTTQAVLDSVSCTAANDCTAAGYYYTNYNANLALPLVESWNGSKWGIQKTPTDPGSLSSFLYGVSCSSADVCTAVGYAAAATDVPLVETWNGKVWSIAAVPNPARSMGSFLRGVSCAATTACTAVGYYISARDVDVTLVEAWNGRTWAVEPSPNVKGVPQTIFNGVSCSTPTSCTAVGQFVTGRHIESMFVAAGTDNVWTPQTTEPVSPAESAFSGASCAAPTLCQAVGVSDLSAHDSFLAEGEGG
jgi:hypothetical protein